MQYWNTKENSYPFDGNNILNLIIDYANKHPEAIAVKDDYGELTYRDLLNIASQNVEVIESDNNYTYNDYILVSVNSGVYLPVAWIMSLIMGTIFVPIDDDWPTNRLKYIMRLTKTNLILHTDEQFDKVKVLSGGEVKLHKVNLENDKDYYVKKKNNANSIFYGFFTSGSTGNPKCSLNHHYGVLNRLQYMSEYFGKGHVVFQNSSHVFDSSIWQILWPLISGGIVIVPSDRRTTDIQYVVDVINANKVTMTDFVPSIFNLLVKYIKQDLDNIEKIKSLNSVIIGGEAANFEYVKTFKSFLPSTRIINTYGHTEASIGMVMGEINSSDRDLALGSPIPNTFVKICNKDLTLCETGFVGQIVVGGICIGNGYLGEDELNSQKFIENPFKECEGNLIYLTGDLGYYDNNKILYYSGREDTEVKINGVLINTAEIENMVKFKYKEIEVFVMKIETIEKSSYLGMVYSTLLDIKENELTEFIGNNLPKEYIPRRVIRLEKIPINQNGKADKLKIEALLKEKIGLISKYDEDEKLKTIVNIVQNYTFEKVNKNTDLKKCYIDSLGTANLVIDIENSLNITLNLNNFYRFNSPEDIYHYCENRSENTMKSTSIPIGEILNNIDFIGKNDDKIDNILLTGCTGFLGIYLLKQILNNSYSNICLLIRASTLEEAYSKLFDRCLKANIDISKYTNRITIIVGDLSKPYLGINKKLWNSLSENIDLIIHAGAEVNFLADYESLLSVNVKSTIDLIEMCSQGINKTFCYISSFAAKNLESEIFIDENYNIDIKDIDDGYGISNAVCEKITLLANQKGLNSKIMRLDDILPSVDTNEFNKKSFIYKFFNACIDLKIVPKNIGGLPATIVDEICNRMLFYLFNYNTTTSKEALIIELSANKLFDIERIFLTIESSNNLKFEYVDYEYFYNFLKKTDNPRYRIISDLLPQPKNYNSIFSSTELTDSNVMKLGYESIARSLTPYQLFTTSNYEYYE